MTGYTGDVHNALRVTGTGFAGLRCRRRVQPTAYGQLGSADWMGEIDVKGGIVAYSVGAMRVILRFRSSRGLPKVAPVRFEDASTGAYLLLSAICIRTVVDIEIDIRCPHLRTPSQRHQTY